MRHKDENLEHCLEKHDAYSIAQHRASKIINAETTQYMESIMQSNTISGDRAAGKYAGH